MGEGDSSKRGEFARKVEKEKGSSSGTKPPCENGITMRPISDLARKILHITSGHLLVKEGIQLDEPAIGNGSDISTQLLGCMFEEYLEELNNEPVVAVSECNKGKKKQSNEEPEQSNEEAPLAEPDEKRLNLKRKGKISPTNRSKKFKNNMEEQDDLQQHELQVNNNNHNMEEQNDVDHPELPIALQEKIQELQGSEVRLVIQKSLYKSDVSSSNSRLSIPKQKIRQEARDFLTPEEETLLNGREGRSVAGLTVSVLDPGLVLHENMCLKRWEMENSRTYNLTHGWMKIVRNNGLESEDEVQLWSFRSHNRQLCFALVKLS